MQDFTQKMTIVVRDDVASWQLTNTVAHIAAYLGNKMSAPFDTGEYFVTRDGVNFPRNSQFAIVTLRATAEEIKKLAHNIRQSGLLWIAYVQEMIDMIDDEELAKAFISISSEETNILGIGMFGSKETLGTLTSTFKLWK